MASSSTSPLAPPGSSTSEERSTPALAATFVLEQLARHRQSDRSHEALVVGIQGPQGSGKSHLAELLLKSPDLAHLSLASISLDDLYLPHTSLAALAESYPTNKLLNGRGQAGTHDLALGVSVLEQLKASKADSTTKVPFFDKSRFNGEGDRVDESEWTVIEGKVDVVIFEGWMLGFRPIGAAKLADVYDLATTSPIDAARQLGLDYDEPFLLQHSREDLDEINERLRDYDALWRTVDCFVQLRPGRMGYVWEWRLEQEHNMKARNGGIGMTDDQVKTFIARYMPGYELFLGGIDDTKAQNSWRGRGLRIQIDKQRKVDTVQPF